MPANRVSQTIISLAVFLAVSIAAATGQGRGPSGKYCGELLSSGIMSEVQTSFRQNASNSALIGNYVFSEQGQPVEGMIVETGDDGDRNDLTRIFIWRDKYGYGKLLATFTPDFSEFTGQWSGGEGSVLSPWNGKRCGFVTS